MSADRKTVAGRFWKLGGAKYNDYKSAYINGELEHPYRLPEIKCDLCNGGNCGEDIVLPYECPPAWKSERFRDPKPVSTRQFQRLASELQASVPAKRRLPLSLIRPGCELQPCFLDIPSKPAADFLWCYIGSVVVSQRIKDLFKELKISGVAFAPVTLRKVGTRSARLSPPIPRSGEPEDIIREVRTVANPNLHCRYYELIVHAQSQRPPGAEPTEVCEACGSLTIDWRKRRLLMLPQMWTGAEVFCLATTAYILVVDRVRQQLQRLGATNLEFEEYPVS